MTSAPTNLSRRHDAHHHKPHPTMTGTKRLRRSSASKMIAGICGGIAEYLDLDPTIVRCVYAVVSVFTGVFPGVLLYVILIAVVPTD